MPVFKIKSTSELDFCYKWLSALSGLLPLTQKELLILSAFLAIYLAQGSTDLDLFRTKNRQQVRKSLNITTHNINNYIKTLKNKKAIFINETGSGITKLLIPTVGKIEEESGIAITINIIL